MTVAAFFCGWIIGFLAGVLWPGSPTEWARTQLARWGNWRGSRAYVEECDGEVYETRIKEVGGVSVIRIHGEYRAQWNTARPDGTCTHERVKRWWVE